MYNLRPEIREKLPSFAREKPTQPMKKDHHYYASRKDNSWNNKARTSKKQYQFYQLYNDRAQPILQNQMHQEVEDQIFINEIRNAKTSFDRCKALERLQSRANERLFLQQKSDQANFQESTNLKLKNIIDLQSSYDKKMMAKAIQAKHVVHSDNKWNFILEADKKHTDFVITDVSIRGEERYVSHVNSKIEEEKSLEDLKRKAYQENHDAIRRSFWRQTERNAELEEKSKLSTKRPHSHSVTKDLTIRTVGTPDIKLETSVTDEITTLKTASSIKPTGTYGLRLSTSGTDDFNPYFADTTRSKESHAPLVQEYGLPNFIKKPIKPLNFGGDSSLGQTSQRLGRTIQRLSEPKKVRI